ncbi:MAG: AI-2E family transporter [Oceanospirillales bacterium]|uniref:Putative permease n=1 Tax=Marinobacterium halophilum TaxID=267374 RepID=A0A2P8F0L4_9GAMM|nr:AI-2E family transporter [Marinobacterium halophilum]MBR9827366.1 AI-2E family transporter [Oceanospirillales bacterium]PSL15256.1 putative permease [Marinobacterium halophilum]
MRKIFRKWIDRYFSDEEALFLFLLLSGALLVIWVLGQPLAPVIASIILAFLMQGVVDWLQRRGIGHLFAVISVFLLFIGFVSAFLLFVLPIVWQQLVNLFNEAPRMVAEVQALLLVLPERYPELVSETQIRELIAAAAAELSQLGQWVLTFSLNSITSIVTLLIYVVLVPILVFFFLKDGRHLMSGWSALLPEKRAMMTRVWHEMDQQIANYVRGKAIEILIVGIISYVTFVFFGINYAALLGILVGLSVVIPYIGAALVTLPVMLIALFQWGWGTDFMYLMIAYGIIQALDGNVLVPLLFSEAVNLHPVSIIVAVLVFGSFWGFWGVFFAIPLATLVKAILSAWPKAAEEVEASAV